MAIRPMKEKKSRVRGQMWWAFFYVGWSGKDSLRKWHDFKAWIKDASSPQDMDVRGPELLVWLSFACPVGECPPNGWACAHGNSLILRSLREKLRAILQATYTHSSNLACFVFTYKALCALQSYLQGETHQVHSFLAGCIGGFLVFKENNNINSQVKILPGHVCVGCLGLGWDMVQVWVGGEGSKKMSSWLPSKSEDRWFTSPTVILGRSFPPPFPRL